MRAFPKTSLLVAAIFGAASIISLHFLHAQETAMPIQDGTPVLADTNDDVSGLSDAEVELRAIEAIPPIPFGQLTERDLIGTFYSAQHSPISPEPWPPLPANIGRLPIWDLGDGIFLLDDRLLNYNLTPIAPFKIGGGRMRAMSGIDPPGGGGGSTNMQPMGFTPPDYGTNLWIAQYAKSSGSMIGTVSNTEADILYEVQSKTDLLQTNWNSEGFIYGSELTNWTSLNVPMSSSSNLFLRIRSWQDDGSGLPIWWQLQYFGATGVDPYGNPAGDGWNNLQKFQNGMNPNQFYTPPTPQGVTVSYNPTNGTATVSWLSSPGAVTNYTVNFNGTIYNVSAGQNSLTEPLSLIPYDILYDPSIYTYFQVQANYTHGSSPQSSTSLVSDYLDGPDYGYPVEVNVIPGPQGSAYLAASPVTLPPGTTAIRLKRIDFYAEEQYGNSSFDTSWDIPVSSLTNGLYLMPAFMQAAPVDSYGQAIYTWWVETVDANGIANSLAMSVYNLIDDGDIYSDDYSVESDYISTESRWFMTPYFDGRAQLKQNLIFLLRAGLNNMPFQFTEFDTNYDHQVEFAHPTNYAYASFYAFNFIPGYPPGAGVCPFLPFGENYLYRNFVFSLSDVNSSGLLPSFANPFNVWENGPMGLYESGLSELPTYQFQLPTTNGASIASLLATNQTRWLLSFLEYDYNDYSHIGIIQSGSTNQLATNFRNTFGLQFLSTEIAWGNSSSQTLTLYPGYNTTQSGCFYSETAQPQFQTVEYDFWNPNLNSLPGMTGYFSTTNTSNLIIAGVGNPNFLVAGYAKLAIQNGYSGAYGYLGQYFTNAYQIDTNGVVTTNTTGILSPYGYFFPTNPGPVALVTMPDIDTGARGTCTVYCVSLQLDKNHDGIMNLSFSGADATSANSPDQIWVNNNYDRGHVVDGSDYEQDDLGPVDVANNHLVPDCQYTTNGQPAIPSTRDLEDYFRLWTPGLAAAMAAAPANYTVKLTLSGDGQIRIFRAYEASGGTNYLFDETTASNQVANSASLYVGLLTSNSPVTLNNRTNEHYIFCGAHTGSAQVDLKILDGNQNVVADAPAYLQINDIKQMYERWTVGDNPNITPTTTPVLATTDLPDPTQLPFQYTVPQDTNTPYILFVHGWNMPAWEKDRYAETEFKRLYWQGYQGRFGEFRWPTYFNFPLEAFQFQAIDLNNFDNSELNAWKSGTGLLNLLTSLNAQYPGQVYLTAHSMGNVVVGEALRQAGASQVVNTYIAMQGAVSAHAYDPSTVNRVTSNLPDNYAHYWTNGAPCYFNGNAGAGTYVNFFNPVDYALSINIWQLDQDVKPHLGYGYNSTYNFWYYGANELSFTADRYTIFAYCDPSWSYALGAQPNVGGAFDGNQVELDALPYSFTDKHKYHSGEFRSDNAQRWQFWNQTLVQMGVK